MKIEFSENAYTMRMAGEILQTSDNDRMHEVGQKFIESADKMDECAILQGVFAYYSIHNVGAIEHGRLMRLLNKLNAFLSQ